MERKEAIEVIKKNWPDSSFTMLREALETLIPELKESEDEKIRKSLLEYLHTLPNHYAHSGVCAPEWIAWLEKQGNNINCIYDKELSELLHIVICRYINDPDISYPERENVSKKILPYVELLEKQGEQKTAEKIEPFDKYEGLTDFERTLADICIGWIGEEFGWKQYIKDNADVLFKIAVEKFNSVQDVPFEQKPAQETKPFKAEHGKYYYCIKDYFCGGRKHASKGDVVQALRGLPIMGLKDASEYFLPVNFIKCNSAWSEEDKAKIQRICKYLDEAKKYYADITEVRECINWLKSIKDRVNPQPQEWSEEDEKLLALSLNNLTELKDRFGEEYGRTGDCIEWLKSLKERYTWKPSDEQIEALDSATENCAYSEYQDCLRELIGQLKKLREE